MFKELPKIGVTRQLLWQEYKEKYPDGYERSQFCDLFGRWCTASPDVTMSLEHKAGDKLFVDFAGATRTYYDHGIAREAQLFVAILGVNQYLYIEAVRSQKKEFLTANRNPLLFLGSVPKAVVCDNLKSAVNEADRYEAVVNPEYDHFASHHGTVIFPARPYSPRDKALVEGAGNIMYTRILAPLRHETFDSLDALKQALWEKLDELNTARFQRLPFSRRDLFESVDSPALKPLPAIRYEYTEFRTLKVGFNYHVEEREYHHFYSVPFAYAKKKVSVAIGVRTIEIYCDNIRIAFHKCIFAPGYSTLPDHRPE
jgi:transposase